MIETLLVAAILLVEIVDVIRHWKRRDK